MVRFVFTRRLKSTLQIFAFAVLSLLGAETAHAQSLPGFAHCEFVPGPDRRIVCLPGMAYRPGVFYGGTNVYDICMVYFGNSQNAQDYCNVLAGGNVGLPGAPQFPAAVGGTVFKPRPTTPVATYTLDEFCDWLFIQPGGIGHYEGLPTWLRAYCETRDPGQIPPGY